MMRRSNVVFFKMSFGGHLGICKLQLKLSLNLKSYIKNGFYMPNICINEVVYNII